MSALGVHFALTDEQVAKLTAIQDDAERRDYILEEVEPDMIESEWAEETDKSWDAIHRCLTGQPAQEKQLISTAGSAPLNLLIMGGRVLDCGDSLFLRLVEKGRLAGLAEALGRIDDNSMRERYDRHCNEAWPEYGDDDREYTIGYFRRLRDFVIRIAPSGRHLLFTATR